MSMSDSIRKEIVTIGEFKITGAFTHFADKCGDKSIPRTHQVTQTEVYYRPIDLAVVVGNTEKLMGVLIPLFGSMASTHTPAATYAISVLRHLIKQHIAFDIDSMDVQINEVGSSRATKRAWAQLRFFKKGDTSTPDTTLRINVNFFTT
jgi:hypothetical protein